MRTNDKVIDPHLDWNEQTPYLKLVVDQDRARALGLTPQDISQATQMLISGAPVTTVRDGIEKVGVVARAVASERLDLGHVGDLTIYARNGVAVPLSQVAKIEYAHEEPILWRRNRDMAITVRSDIVDGVQAPDVTNAIWPKLEKIRQNLQPAYRIEMGGAIEESAKGKASNLRAVSADGDRHADIADDPVAKLFAPGAGVPHRAARDRRRGARPSGRAPAIRLRGPAGLDRAGWYDHAKRGDSGRSDRERCRPRTDAAGGDRGGHGAAGPAGDPDGAGRDFGDDSVVAVGVLGAQWRSPSWVGCSWRLSSRCFSCRACMRYGFARAWIRAARPKPRNPRRQFPLRPIQDRIRAIRLRRNDQDPHLDG